MRRRARRGGGRQVELAIEALGGRGDGLGTLDGRPVFVPFALPGERARARLTGERAGGYKAELLELLAVAPERTDAPCPHFGPCGGCALQHLADARYGAWKQGLVAQALARRGLSAVAVRPLRRIVPGSRRRAALAALRRGARVTLGFHRRDSHAVEDLATCLLLTPRLVALLPALRAALGALLEEGAAAEAVAIETDTGVDLLIVSKTPPGLEARAALAAFAEAQDLARLSWAPGPRAGEALAPEPLALRRLPRLDLGGVAVCPPPGGFVQPSQAGAAALVELVLAALPEAAATIFDLFAGCGTFSFPLARRARVHAIERDEAALAALWDAARKSDLAGRIAVEARDLARAPLNAAELAEGDAVVFDPPRAGAREQAAEIARAAVPTVIAVSCNPKTFARDARLLVDGGYELCEVTPVDQFPWSGHLELVARFRR